MSEDVVHLGGNFGRSAAAIVGTAAINALAFNSHQTWAFWRAETSGFIETPFRCANGERATMALVRTLSPKQTGAPRLWALLNETLTPLSASLHRFGARARIGVAVGLGNRFDRPQIRSFSTQAHQLETALRKWFADQELALMACLMPPEGHAAFATAAVQSMKALRDGVLDAVVLGGVESYYDPRVVETLLDADRLFDLEHPDRFIPGEGAALLLMTTPSTASQLSLVPQGHMESAARATEIGSRGSGAPCQGTGLTAVMRAIGDRLKAERRRLDWLFADLTAESDRTREFGLAFPRAFAPGGLDDQGRGYYQLTSSRFRTDFVPERFGDLGAASMPTAAIVALEAFLRGDPEAETCLVTGSADGGQRGAVLLSAARAINPKAV